MGGHGPGGEDMEEDTEVDEETGVHVHLHAEGLLAVVALEGLEARGCQCGWKREFTC